MNDVDDLLRQDGERWREQQPAPREHDFSALTRTRPVVRVPRPVRTSWPRLAPALAAVALVGAVATGVAVRHTAGPGPAATTDPMARLIVHDGDPVQLTGRVRIAPDGAATACAPLIAQDGLTATDAGPVCPLPIPIDGLDPVGLGDRSTRNGYTTGYAELHAVFRDGRLAVRRQQPATQEDGTVTVEQRATAAPCPSTGEEPDPDGLTKLQDYLRDRPDRFDELWYALPPTGETFWVGTVDPDLDAVRNELRLLYSGPLCVTRAVMSSEQRSAAAAGVSALIGASRVYEARGDGGVDRRLPVLVSWLDQGTYDQLARIGLRYLTVHAWITPDR